MVSSTTCVLYRMCNTYINPWMTIYIFFGPIRSPRTIPFQWRALLEPDGRWQGSDWSVSDSSWGSASLVDSPYPCYFGELASWKSRMVDCNLA